MDIRERTISDVPMLEQLLRRVHEVHGYPRHWPESPACFLTAPEREILAWVATDDDGPLVGHVAVHGAVGDPMAAEIAKLAGLRAEDVEVVARLFVAPERGGMGIGRLLLSVAADAIVRRGRIPVLSVVTDRDGAQKLYASAGWTSCGTFDFVFRDGRQLELAAFVRPPDDRRR